MRSAVAENKKRVMLAVCLRMGCRAEQIELGRCVFVHRNLIYIYLLLYKLWTDEE